MINFDDFTKKTKNEHNPNWQHIPEHSYRTLFIKGYGSGKQTHYLI